MDMGQVPTCFHRIRLHFNNQRLYSEVIQIQLPKGRRNGDEPHEPILISEYDFKTS